ncbi:MULTISPECIES: hypothetical protein [unclassified Bradyrhizobium]|uniref:hypothetical protein n=1 Tax=unclassified Bradyrhizobium TaxID=2631580 RepID=UPI0024797CFC|nr:MULTISPECIES: hypothetical protein [unclassified Bradyrhizobium]WGR91700.1 hypothetical protein MTX20_25490 [Bradyrhizobium sp. ISRA435]WGS02033.1 hypothetical protein MTX23_14970 [Bradyrhizobium sp. ISRA436]WGS08918.1 hypothetical protein MTX18_14960 [Bradyrhizobium sp. ISRA437]WGS15807.1 hypothetical protein MTX26_14960 [Bradyrhizobium sp. ISRA443]WGS23499.1 hypothetical protein MTX22_18870 [Bradyrhizobium sp. ISRA463]
MPYALFDRDRQIDQAFPTEKEAWEHALISGLVLDVPVADDAAGQVLPAGYQMRFVSGDGELIDPPKRNS